MATEAARLEDKELTGRKKKNRLDSHRPSHGRTYRDFGRKNIVFLPAVDREPPTPGDRAAISQSAHAELARSCRSHGS